MALIDDLISYYKLDETSGNRIDAQGSNNLTNIGPSYGATGKINTAAGFDGNNDRLESSSTSFITTNYTMNLWVNPDSFASNDRYFDDKAVGNNNGFLAYSPDTSGKIRFTTYNGSSGHTLDTTSNLSTGSYQMITFTQDSSGNKKIYRNGVVIGSASGVNTHTPGQSTLKFGTNVAANADFYDGKMDEIGIWSRALSLAEIQELYNSGAGLAYPFSAATLRKIKISGTFVDKPILTKVSGTFVDKPIKIKVGGTFQ